MRKELIETKILFVDSSKSSEKSSEDNFTVQIPNKIMTCEEDEYIEVELSEFTCKRDFYAVQNFNKFFSIYHTGTDHSYSLREGNPNVINIDNELKTDFEAEFPGETFTVSFDQYTGKITISATFTGTVPADLALNTNVDNSAFEVIGFTKKNHAFTINGQAVSLTGDRPVNMSGEQNIFLRTSLVSENVNNSLNSGLVLSNILAKFPILSAPYSNITFFNTDHLFTTRINSKNINSFTVRLTNENEDLIGLQSNSMMTFTFRKYRTIKDDAEDYLKQMLEIQRLKFIKKN